MTSRINEPLFVISVAARLVQMHPQTLRKYEREGLIVPSRTSGNLRLYSDRDIELLRQVKYLVEDRGLNLAGVQLALELTAKLRLLRDRTDEVAGRSSAGIPMTSEEFASQMSHQFDQLLRILGHVDEPS
jgi:MerR family transcriptional regulator, heat shock protein HspR